MLPKMPANLPPLPKDHVYLGAGGTFEKPKGLFYGYFIDSSSKWIQSVNGFCGQATECHYCAHKDSAIVKLNTKPKRRKTQKTLVVEDEKFNKNKYYGLETHFGREFLIATEFDGKTFASHCVEQFSNHNVRFSGGAYSFENIVKLSKSSDWKLFKFNTFAALCRWAANHPNSKKEYT